MKKDIVIVKDYYGKPLLRRVWGLEQRWYM